jgi:hypothetical protein
MHTITNTEVVILGGGPAGIAAAVSASRQGLDVALIERNAFLGGKATAAEVGTVCGLYAFSKKEQAEYLVKGFAREFAEHLRTGSGTTSLHNNNGLHYLPYDIGVFKTLCGELLQQHKVKVFFDAIPYKADISSDRIRSVLINVAGKDMQFNAGVVIDCSGESIISQLTNTPTIKSDNYQAAAQVFTLKDIGDTTEMQLGMILMKELRSAIDKQELADYYDRVYVVQGSLKNNCVSLKLGLPLPVTHTPENLESLTKMAHSFVEELTAFLVGHVPLFKNASIEHIAPEVGIRVGLRTMGNYILTEDDVLSCRKFDDAIANSAWPIEEWGQDKRVKMRYFEHDDFYQVPASCLHSSSINNLFMAGRNISASDGAIASARVMGICLQTGYAAGMLAAAHLREIPEKEMLKKIQEAQL